MLKWLKPKFAASFLLILCAITLFFRHSQSLFSDSRPIPSDFKVYVLAAERARAGLNPYIPSEETPYKYSPGALAVFYLLPPKESLAWVIFKLVSLFSWIAAILVGVSLQTWKQFGLLFLGIVLSWKGLLETLDYGQIEFLFLFIAVLSARLFERSRFFSGVCLGYLPWLKLQWGLLLFPFLMNAITGNRTGLKRFVLGGLTSAVFFGFLIPMIIFGPSEILNLMRSWVLILQVQPTELYLGNVNQNVWSTVSRWVSYDPFLGRVGGVLLILWTLLLILKLIWNRTSISAVRPLLFVTPWLVLTQLVSPLGWRYGSILLVGTPFLWNFSIKMRWMKLSWVLSSGIFLLFLLQQNPVVKAIGLSHWTDLHSFGTVTLYWLMILTLCVLRSKPDTQPIDT